MYTFKKIVVSVDHEKTPWISDPENTTNRKDLLDAAARSAVRFAPPDGGPKKITLAGLVGSTLDCCAQGGS